MPTSERKRVFILGAGFSKAAEMPLASELTDRLIDVAVFIDGVETWELDGRVRAIVEVQREAGDDLDVHLFPGTFVSAAPKGSFAEFILKEGVAVVIPNPSR